jgi:hypothetical protein
VTAHHNSTVRMRDCELHTCTGGVFLWNSAVCEVSGHLPFGRPGNTTGESYACQAVVCNGRHA